jgi:hypothetical protein
VHNLIPEFPKKQESCLQDVSCECPSGFTGPLCEEEVAACGGAFRNPVGRIDFPPEEGATYGHQLSCDFLISVEEGKVLMCKLQSSTGQGPIQFYEHFE